MGNSINKKGSLKTFFICALAGLIIFLGAYYLRHFLYWLFPVIPIPYIILRLKNGFIHCLVALCVLFLFACIICRPLNAVVLSLPVIMCVVLCGYVLGKRLSAYYALLYCCCAALLSFLIFIGLLYAVKGATIYGIVSGLAQKEVDATPDITVKVLYKYLSAVEGGKELKVDTLSLDSLNAVSPVAARAGVMRIIENAILLLIPEICSFGVCLLGLIYTIIPFRAAKKAGVEVTNIPDFSNWALPQNVGFWGIGCYIGALVLASAGLSNFDIVYAIIAGGFDFIFGVQGLAFIDWLLKKKVASVALRVLILALLWVLTSPISLFVWIGLVEQFARFRERKLKLS